MARIVFDIGGTNIKYGIYDDGILKNTAETPTEAHNGGASIIEKVANIIKSNLNYTIDSIGISTAGQIDSKKGIVAFANDNIPNYTGFEIKKYLEDRFSLPCYVENDVNCAGIGELFTSKDTDESKAHNFVFIAYGTGIGGAIIINNEVLTGHNFFAGGIGQMRIFDKDTNEYCQYEDIASTKYLVKKANKINSQITNGRQIFEHIDDEQILETINQWVSNIVIGLINITYLIDPEYIVLGGGIMENEFIFSKVLKKYESIKNPFLKSSLKQASAGNKAGLIGAGNLK